MEVDCRHAARISEAVTNEVIQTWEPGAKILIHGTMGIGKTWWTWNVYAPYIREIGGKILVLVSRKGLKDQLRQYIYRKHIKNIEVWSYQRLEKRLTEEQNYDEIVAELTSFTSIICDEAQYWIADAAFNLNTYFSYHAVMNRTDGVTKIMLSATPQDLEAYLQKRQIVYTAYRFDTTYKLARSINFFEKEDTIHQCIRRGLKNKIKTIVFMQKAEDAAKLYLQYRDYGAQLITSTAAYNQYVDTEKYNRLVRTEKFEELLLITTLKLEVGFTIKDKAVQQIIIDIFDPLSGTQCAGRKRPENTDDKADLYIRTRRGYDLSNPLHRKNEILQKISEFENAPLDYIDAHRHEKDWHADCIIYPRSSEELSTGKSHSPYTIRYLRKFYYASVVERIMKMQRYGIDGYQKLFIEYLNADIEPQTLFENNELLNYLDMLTGENGHYIMATRQARESFIKKLDVKKNYKLCKRIEVLNEFLKTLPVKYQLIKLDVYYANGKRYRGAWKLIRM